MAYIVVHEQELINMAYDPFFWYSGNHRGRWDAFPILRCSRPTYNSCYRHSCHRGSFRSFVRMDQVRAGQKPVEFLIEDVQVDLCGAHHPVGHGVGLKSYPTVLITAGLPFQRKMIVVFSIDDGSHQRGRGDAVAEEIRGTSDLNNAAVIVPGGVLVDMVLIHKESLWDDGQTLIASDPPVRFYDRRNAGSRGQSAL